MNTCQRWMLVGCLAVSMLAPPALSQEGTQKPASPAVPAVDELGDCVYTGRYNGREVPQGPARKLRESVAKIQVSIDVDRKFEPSLEQLDELQFAASRRGDPERGDLLVEIALARAGALSALGKNAQALRATKEILPSREFASRHPSYELTAANEEDLAMAAQAAADPRLVALRAKLEKGVAQRPADGDDKIEEIVNDAVLNARQGIIVDLGDRALPALEKLAAKELDSLPPTQNDPLLTIATLNPRRAADFMRANFDRGGSIWKARMLRAMKQVGPFKWRSVGNRLELENPEWLPIVERLLDEPTTVREAFALIKKLSQFDALSVGMQQRAAKILNGENSAVAAAAMDALEERGRPSSKQVFEAVLASPNGEVRAFAARQLAAYETSDALLASHSSPDPSVRAQVAVALGDRECSRFVNGSSTENYPFDPPNLSAGQREILSRLVADPAPEVRVAAANSIIGLSTPLDDTVYERIGKDSDSRVRATLLKANAVPVPVQAKIALALASDADIGVLRSFDSFAARVLALSDAPLDPAYLPAIEARLRNSALPFKLDGSYEHQFYARIPKTPEGLAAIARWALEIKSSLTAYAVRSIEDRVGKRSSTTSEPWPRGTVSAAAVGIRLTPQELAGVFKLASTLGDLNERVFVSPLILLSDDLAPAFLPIARDAKQDKQVRLQALDIAARGQPEQVSDCLLELMADPGWQSSNVKQLSAHASSIGNGMNPQGAARTFEKIFENVNKFDPILASSFAYGYAMARPLDARSADRILAAWFDNKEVGPAALQEALKQVASRPREAQGDWMIRAVHDSRFWASALYWLGDMRDPSYLGLLEEGLSKGYMAGSNSGNRTEALNALTRYFSEPAAEIILKVAGSTANAELREQCFKALDTIRQYKAEKGRWDDDRVSKEATATAVRDLVTLLDDATPAVRAQAVRGLGTLHAVEHMPRIVRMLKDGDAEVRKAADEALRVLNSPPEKKD